MYKKIFLLLSILVLVSLACGGSSTPTDTPVPPTSVPAATLMPTMPIPTSLPTIAQPQPTIAPPTSQPVPTIAPQVQTGPYFKEEFEGDLSLWSYFHSVGDENDYEIWAENGWLKFRINEYQTYTYFVYTGEQYTDVRIDAAAENRGANTNFTGLVCRVTEEGWYEFNINSSGLYQIWKVTDDYYLLRSGGSTSIKQGIGESNHYTAICDGERLSLYVNDTELWTIKDSYLKEGFAGVTVSSEQYKPVEVHFDWVEFSQP